MVGSTLGVYSFGLILFLQAQIKDIIIIIRHKNQQQPLPNSFQHILFGIF